jgi:hypothetical protein
MSTVLVHITLVISLVVAKQHKILFCKILLMVM